MHHLFYLGRQQRRRLPRELGESLLLVRGTRRVGVALVVVASRAELQGGVEHLGGGGQGEQPRVSWVNRVNWVSWPTKL